VRIAGLFLKLSVAPLGLYPSHSITHSLPCGLYSSAALRLLGQYLTQSFFDFRAAFRSGECKNEAHGSGVKSKAA
jgi:hypothetical protein